MCSTLHSPSTSYHSKHIFGINCRVSDFFTKPDLHPCNYIPIFIIRSSHAKQYIQFQVEHYLDEFNHEMAKKFCERALEMDSNNVRALETFGTLLLEMDDQEGAKQVSHIYV